MGGQLQCENWVKALQLTGQADKKTRRMNIDPLIPVYCHINHERFRAFTSRHPIPENPNSLNRRHIVHCTLPRAMVPWYIRTQFSQITTITCT
jgi:hypothetical protein